MSRPLARRADGRDTTDHGLRATSGPTERFLQRLGAEREVFVRSHFDAAWGRYEPLTSLCTLGFDRLWRRRCVAACDLAPDGRLLDIGTGTGQLVGRALRALGANGLAVGLDMSLGGLARARRSRRGEAKAGWVQARAPELPVRDGCFDAVTAGFALRHLGPLECLLPEVHRILVPGGRVALLVFLRPADGPRGRIGLAYLEWVVPAVVGLVSRRRAVARLARYLPATIREAASCEEVTAALAAAGFMVVRRESLCWGLVWLVVGERAAATPGQGPARATLQSGEGRMNRGLASRAEALLSRGILAAIVTLLPLIAHAASLGQVIVEATRQLRDSLVGSLRD